MERLRRLVGVSVVLLVVFSNTMLSIPGLFDLGGLGGGWARGFYEPSSNEGPAAALMGWTSDSPEFVLCQCTPMQCETRDVRRCAGHTDTHTTIHDCE